MAYSWFRVDSSVVDHPKVLLLSARLGDPNALAYVVRLWSWAQRYAPTGKIDRAILPHVERAMGWQGAAGDLCKNLIEVGLIDDENECVFVHDWDEMQGKLVEKASRDANLKRKSRRQNGARRNGAEIAPDVRPALLRTRRDGRDETDGTKAVAGPTPPPVQNEVFALQPQRPPPTPAEASEWQTTIARLVDAYAQARAGAKYAFSPRDAKSLKGLLAKGDADEVLRRWKLSLSLATDPYQPKKVSSLPDLDEHWNAYATAPVRDLTRGVAPPSTGHVVGFFTPPPRKAAP